MRIFLLVSVFVLISVIYGSALYADIDLYPKLIVAELATASWSDDAGDAYTGMDFLMTHYHYGEVIPVRYYTSQDNGQFSSPAVENLIQDYSVTSFPSLIVNGRNRVSGTTGFPVSTGLPYRSMVEREYYEPSPVKIEMVNYNPISGDVQVLVTMLSETESLQNVTARFILIEDNVTGNVTNLARDIQEEIFSLAGQNNTINLSTTFTLDASWDTGNLSVLMYIYDSAEGIIQAVSSKTIDNTYLRAVIPYQRMDVGPSTGLFEAEYFKVFNMGAAADFTIDTTIDQAPDSWFVTYCNEDGLCFFGPYDFSLQNAEYTEFHANIIAEGPGMIDYSFVIISDSLAEDYVIPFRYISYDVDYMIIDGDGWADYESYPAQIMEANQYTYGIWDSGYADVRESISQYYKTLIWLTGEREPSLKLHETDFLRNHLNEGNNLFISGQNIGKDLVNNPLYSDPGFFHDYLNADLIEEQTTQRQISGIAGDYISDGLSFSITGGDGAGNQYSPEVISPGQQNGAVIFRYGDDSVAGIRSILPGSNAGIVYLPFGFEAIDNHDDRNATLINSLNWLETTAVVDNELPAVVSAAKLLPSYPNPFSLKANTQGTRQNKHITIPFYIERQQLAHDAAIRIYNIKGQLIKTLTDLRLQDDKYGQVIWNVNDDYNKRVVSGVYFYALTNGDETHVRKMLIIY